MKYVIVTKLALAVFCAQLGPMDRRNRRSSDRRSALHLFLESQLAALGARSLRVITATGEMVAGVGDDAYTDEWVPSWTRNVEGTSLVVASSGGRWSEDVALGIRRIVDGISAPFSSSSNPSP